MRALSELLDAGRYKEASEQARQRLAQNPSDGEALLAMARLSLQAGQPEQAERLLNRASPHRSRASKPSYSWVYQAVRQWKEELLS